MTGIVTLAGFLGMGLAIGLLDFGGLWLTVRALPSSKRPGLLTAISFVGRLGVAVLGYYVLSTGEWQQPVVAVAGFILVRLLLACRWGPEPGASSP